MNETADPSSAAGKGPPMERVLEGRSMARTLLHAMRDLNASLDRVCLGIGYLCGGLFLMLAFFITYQSLAREYGWIMSPGTDQLSGYVMAMGSTWAFAYALQAGAHVRIDVLLPYMSPRVRAVADWVAVASMAFFVCITAWKTWRMALRSYELGALSNDYPLTPIWIPQSLVAIGFSMVSLIAVYMLVHAVAEGALPVFHKWAGGTESYRAVSSTSIVEDSSIT